MTHVGHAMQEEFGIPPEWVSLFRKAGVKDEELRDKHTQAFLIKAVCNAAIPQPPPPPLAQMMPVEAQEVNSTNTNYRSAPDLLSQIKNVKLKKMDPATLDPRKFTEQEQSSIASQIAAAMALRRPAMADSSGAC